MTEEEAKTKFCHLNVRSEARPMMSANYGKNDTGGVTASMYEPPNSYCIGSACMDWIWEPDARAELSENIVFVDARDEDLLQSAWWDGKYARTEAGRVHRLVAERAIGAIPEGKFVDHIDGDPCNNRRGNLRVVTKAQNAANAASRGGRSKFRGVFCTRNGKWAAQIAKGGIRESLGTFATEEEAAAAYDAAAGR